MPRLLVVDDRPEICDVIAAYMREEGHDVAIANHGMAARNALQRERYDVLIVDLVLPGSSGLALAEIAAARATAVLMISGEPSMIEKMTVNAAHRFLQKPFHLAELGSAVRALLKTRRAEVPPAHSG
jgi:two-component system, OmpR family, response regulator